MNGVFYIGATGLHAEQRALDMVANNIANINTPSFKRSEPKFAELLSGLPAMEQRGRPALAYAAGVMSVPGQRAFEQGDLKITGKLLDIAIDGTGFIELMGPSGQTLLWRGGGLKVDGDGFLATADGVPLKAMVSIPEGLSALSIGRDGVVRGIAPGETAAAELGRIELAMVKDVDALEALDGGLYRLRDGDRIITAAAGEEGAGALVQGSIEASNVNLSDEMVQLLVMQRAYAANAQLVQAGDQLMSIANGMKRA